MTGLRLKGDPELRALVGTEPGRAEYYAEVMGLVPVAAAGGSVLDLGTGGPEALALAQAVMSGFGQIPAEVMRGRLGALRVAAAGRVRAADAAGRILRTGSGEASVSARRHVHAGFFGLEVLELTHRRFDGSMCPPIRRELFVMGDAVTVLPYDPLRDRVLLVEQFRVGPLGRGDPLPWQLEAIAGRIDPGETPEECARREAVEEAGLVLGRLEKVADYYPSPGAVTEFVYSFIALCDLPDGVAGIFGQEDEAEDIRGQLVPFDRLMDAVAKGEIGNAPLILTALWLQRERARLRSDVSLRNV
ncbi:NUDIX domain-containing protein [Tabrizicola sp. YIM 78059]|uniref:NUDIX domain-containing protein n=1 Tax=Tabrizicola sp. YIM 78059 TaxID=2529861 RepID=UPI0010AAA464|nr:NUDIX domain-containing protein [Tabrizicola sp. YIM 78059]